MKQSIRSVIFLVLFIGAGITLRAQDFNYTVSTDSVAWNELNAKTILNANDSQWEFSYKVPIGFTFNYLGRNFDSLTIETNGYIVFDSDRHYALTAFNGLGDCLDSVGHHSILGYEVSGTSGSRVLKIQYKDCGVNGTAAETQSWQIWMRENGSVEFRIGPGTLRDNELSVTVQSVLTQEDSTYTILEVDTLQKVRIGLLNMNMDTEVRGVFIGNNPGSPQTLPVNDAQPEIALLNSAPACGYRYTFSPVSN